MIGVVVLTKDRPDLFARCAESVGEGPPVAERVLVQNGTDPETVQAAKLAGWRVIEPGENLSFSAGNNRAVASMDREQVTHVLLLNNDVILRPDMVTQLWADRGSADVIGCVILDPCGLINHAGVVQRPDGWMDHLGRGLSPTLFAHDVENLPAVTFACAMVRLEAWDNLGGLDEGYWYCFEDVDFCLRLRELGGRIKTCAAAVVIHDESSTRCPYETSEDANAKRFKSRWLDTGRIWAALEML